MHYKRLKTYTSESFKAWNDSPETFQLKIRDYPVILCFTFDEFNDFRQDLTRFKLPLAHRFDFLKKLEYVRIYGIRSEELIYICFTDLEGTAIGFSEPHFLQFTKDAISFNPQGAFEGYLEHSQKRLTNWG